MSQAIPQPEAARIAHFMGLREWKTTDDLHLVKRVKSGLSVSTARAIAKRIDPIGAHLGVDDLIPKASHYSVRTFWRAILDLLLRLYLRCGATPDALGIRRQGLG